MFFVVGRSCSLSLLQNRAGNSGSVGLCVRDGERRWQSRRTAMVRTFFFFFLKRSGEHGLLGPVSSIRDGWTSRAVTNDSATIKAPRDLEDFGTRGRSNNRTAVRLFFFLPIPPPSVRFSVCNRVPKFALDRRLGGCYSAYVAPLAV